MLKSPFEITVPKGGICPYRASTAEGPREPTVLLNAPPRRALKATLCGILVMAAVLLAGVPFTSVKQSSPAQPDIELRMSKSDYSEGESIKVVLCVVNRRPSTIKLVEPDFYLGGELQLEGPVRSLSLPAYGTIGGGLIHSIALQHGGVYRRAVHNSLLDAFFRGMPPGHYSLGYQVRVTCKRPSTRMERALPLASDVLPGLPEVDPDGWIEIDPSSPAQLDRMGDEFVLLQYRPHPHTVPFSLRGRGRLDFKISPRRP